jgi:hypothetical protein
MVTINILLYTDTKRISENPAAFWSIQIVKEILESKISEFVQYKLSVVHRYPDQTGNPRKIDQCLLKPYDELWLFGFYRENDGPGFDDTTGGPRNELEEDERLALSEWMTNHGVLIAGDHAEPRLGGTVDDPVETFLCLGKALGKRVPRAGQMRKWEGPPTNAEVSSFNTLVTTAQLDVTSDTAQSDEVPQKLLLSLLSPDSLTHPIFSGKDAGGNYKPIDIFPDHRHEGEVIVPAELDDEWPHPEDLHGRQRRGPVIVANGCDKRSCRSGAVLAVYDGDGLGAGRIVADSSWHHYFNTNLRGLKVAGDDDPDNKAFALISQFYPNLALYLAPEEKRRTIGSALLEWVKVNPDVREERGNPPLVVGKIALSHLAKVATGYEIFELLQTLIPDRLRREYPLFNFPPLIAGMRTLPPRELILGSVINKFYASKVVRTDAESMREKAEIADHLVTVGLREAFSFHRDEAQKVASVAEKVMDSL